MPFFLHLLLKLLVLHGTFNLKRFHLLRLLRPLFAYLKLLLPYPFNEFLGLFGTLAQEMELITPNLAVPSRASAGVHRSRYQAFIPNQFALVDLFSEIDQLVLDEHVFEFDSVGWLFLNRDNLLLPGDFMYVIMTFLDVSLDTALNLCHNEVELVGESLVA